MPFCLLKKKKVSEAGERRERGEISLDISNLIRMWLVNKGHPASVTTANHETNKPGTQAWPWPEKISSLLLLKNVQIFHINCYLFPDELPSSGSIPSREPVTPPDALPWSMKDYSQYPFSGLCYTQNSAYSHKPLYLLLFPHNEYAYINTSHTHMGLLYSFTGAQESLNRQSEDGMGVQRIA